ncbi:hypothetical protein BD779DRAFT_1476368 [Infundibulicybe gibba]|nr:hypothetical protein BD779DRAFT_1476368 [Infundibulicybe gibba]
MADKCNFTPFPCYAAVAIESEVGSAGTDPHAQEAPECIGRTPPWVNAMAPTSPFDLNLGCQSLHHEHRSARPWFWLLALRSTGRAHLVLARHLASPLTKLSLYSSHKPDFKLDTGSAEVSTPESGAICFPSSAYRAYTSFTTSQSGAAFPRKRLLS